MLVMRSNYLWGGLLTTSTTPIRIQGPNPRLLGGLDLTEGTLVSEARKPVLLFRRMKHSHSSAMHGRWEKLDALCDDDHELSHAKKGISDTLISYYTTNQVSEKQMQKVATVYGKALSRHFGGADKVASHARRSIFRGWSRGNRTHCWHSSDRDRCWCCHRRGCGSHQSGEEEASVEGRIAKPQEVGHQAKRTQTDIVVPLRPEGRRRDNSRRS